MTLASPPVVRTTKLIRRAVEEVFDAFVDPAVTTRFWFTRSSERLARGETVTWYWDQYGIHGDVRVTALENDRRMAIEWPPPVEWSFTPGGDGATAVSIVASGLTDQRLVREALNGVLPLTFFHPSLVTRPASLASGVMSERLATERRRIAS
mgnify:CR=1 FL=1